MPNGARERKKNDYDGKVQVAGAERDQAGCYSGHDHAPGQNQPPLVLRHVDENAGGDGGGAAGDLPDGVQRSELEIAEAQRLLDDGQHQQHAGHVPVGDAVADGQVGQDEGAAPGAPDFLFSRGCRASAKSQSPFYGGPSVFATRNAVLAASEHRARHLFNPPPRNDEARRKPLLQLSESP